MIVRIRQEPCPLCGASGGLLNGAQMNGAGMNFPKLILGCRPCLETRLKDASKLSVGDLFFHQSMEKVENRAAVRELESGKATKALREYVWLNRGEWAHLLK